jgi:ATP-dependent helicase/nuclease subunit B
MAYGLGLAERRVAGMDSRNIGDVYHNTLMRFGRELSADGLSVSDESSRWQTATDDEIDEAARRIAVEEYSALMAGSAAATGTSGAAGLPVAADPTLAAGSFATAEEDMADAAADTYRMNRVSGTASLAARALTHQIREGRIRDIRFESKFGKGGDFPPIVFADGRMSDGFQLEGRIDRVDIMEGGYARIIDYKSGAQAFSAPDAAAGYQLQLMLYLKAVSERYEPAGVFYFMIKEPRIKDEGGAGASAGIMREMKLDGVAIGEARLLEAMGMDPDGKSRKGKMERDEFIALQGAVDTLVGDLMEGMASGRIDADPKTAVKLKTSDGRNMRACDYCRYKGICNYDPVLT